MPKNLNSLAGYAGFSSLHPIYSLLEYLLLQSYTEEAGVHTTPASSGAGKRPKYKSITRCPRHYYL